MNCSYPADDLHSLHHFYHILCWQEPERYRETTAFSAVFWGINNTFYTHTHVNTVVAGCLQYSFGCLKHIRTHPHPTRKSWGGTLPRSSGFNSSVLTKLSSEAWREILIFPFSFTPFEHSEIKTQSILKKICGLLDVCASQPQVARSQGWLAPATSWHSSVGKEERELLLPLTLFLMGEKKKPFQMVFPVPPVPALPQTIAGSFLSCLDQSLTREVGFMWLANSVILTGGPGWAASAFIKNMLEMQLLRLHPEQSQNVTQ